MFQGLTFEPFRLPSEAEKLRAEVREFLTSALDPEVLPNSDFKFYLQVMRSPAVTLQISNSVEKVAVQ